MMKITEINEFKVFKVSNIYKHTPITKFYLWSAIRYTVLSSSNVFDFFFAEKLNIDVRLG